MTRLYGKSIASHFAITAALRHASRNGVPCSHEADFYYYHLRTAWGRPVRPPAVVVVPKGASPCTTQ